MQSTGRELSWIISKVAKLYSEFFKISEAVRALQVDRFQNTEDVFSEGVQTMIALAKLPNVK